MITELVVIPAPVLLEQLLAQRLPRGNRCGQCRHWRSDDGREGACIQDVPARALCDGCGARDGCYEWFSRLPQPAWYDADYEEDLHGHP